MADEVLKTIIRQLEAQNVNLKNKRLVKIDDKTLRVHRPSKKIGDGTAKSVDISYDEGWDLYNVEVHKIKGVNVKTKRYKGMYFDQIPQFF